MYLVDLSKRQFVYARWMIMHSLQYEYPVGIFDLLGRTHHSLRAAVAIPVLDRQ
jgi:hypothetical protein